MRNLLATLIVTLCLVTMSSQALAAKGKSRQPAQDAKERLVLMPLTLEEEDRKQQGAMEAALIQGLQQKYEVFAGEQVTKKAKEVFNKENRTAKKHCDETRCMQGIAEAFQAELIATANVTKKTGGWGSSGYFLALKIENIFDNKAVYSNSLVCKGCDSFDVVGKLKELSGASAQAAPNQADNSFSTDKSGAPVVTSKATEQENALWDEVKKGDSISEYAAYLKRYPKGIYAELAKSRIAKFQEAAAADSAKQEQRVWDKATRAATQESYQDYLHDYPKGRYEDLAKTRIQKLQEESAAALVKLEQSDWDSANSIATQESYKDYLSSYPKGRYSSQAKIRIAKLQKEAAKMAARKPSKNNTRQEEEMRNAAVIEQVVQRLGGDGARQPPPYVPPAF